MIFIRQQIHQVESEQALYYMKFLNVIYFKQVKKIS